MQSELSEIRDTLALLNARIDQVAAVNSEEINQLQELIKKAGATWESAREDVKQKGQHVDSYVREHPWETAAIALGAGVVLAMLLSKQD